MTKIRQIAELIVIIFVTIVLRRPALLAGRTASSVEPAAGQSDAHGADDKLQNAPVANFEPEATAEIAK
jgi:hypothetical protein